MLHSLVDIYRDTRKYKLAGVSKDFPRGICETEACYVTVVQNCSAQRFQVQSKKSWWHGTSLSDRLAELYWCLPVYYLSRRYMYVASAYIFQKRLSTVAGHKQGGEKIRCYPVESLAQIHLKNRYLLSINGGDVAQYAHCMHIIADVTSFNVIWLMFPDECSEGKVKPPSYNIS